MKHRLLLLGPLLLAACNTDIAAPSQSAQSMSIRQSVGNGPSRYQTTTTAYEVTVLGTYIHDYTVTTNPCDGSIAITGATPLLSGYYTTETLTGTLTGGVISYHSVYDGPYNPGYAYDGSFPVAGGALSGSYTGTVALISSSATNYQNHGEYVSQNPDKNDAAHSCIGMPIH